MEGNTVNIYYLRGKKRKLVEEYWEGLPIFTLAYISAFIPPFLVCLGAKYYGWVGRLGWGGFWETCLDISGLLYSKLHYKW